MALSLRHRFLARMHWDAGRCARAWCRRFDGASLLLASSVLVAAAAWLVERRQLDATAALAPLPAAQPPWAAREDPARAALDAFDRALPAHEQIPAVVQDLIELAEREGLLLARADYRPQFEAHGRFLRYRMTLPVKGDAAAVRRFLAAALRAHRTLALEGVQFKRERADAKELEARIQWALLTRLPTLVTRQRGQDR